MTRAGVTRARATRTDGARIGPARTDGAGADGAGPDGARVRGALLACAAAVAFAVATRPGPLGGLAVAAATLLAAGLRSAPTRIDRAVVAAIAALGPASVAVAPFAPVAPRVVPALALLVAGSFAWLGALPLAGARGPRSAAARAALLACAWCATEAAWGAPFLAGRWALPTLAVGTALVDGPGLALAPWIGMRGMSLVTVAAGAWIAGVPTRPARAGLALAAAGLLGPWAQDVVLGGPAANAGAIPIRIVQHAPTPASIAAVRLDPASERAHADVLARHTADAEGRLVVWPEAVTARPWSWTDPSVRPALIPADADVLFGSATARDGGRFNSALLWHAGRLRVVHDKVRLVPVTEDGLDAGRVREPARWRGLGLAAAICWEAVFPGDARRAARAGADALFVLANDAYAGSGPVPWLHLRIARLRAAEVGLPTAFVQATGPSAGIGPDGRVLRQLGHGRAGSIDVDLPRASGATLYRRTGDLVGPGAGLASLLIAAGRVSRLLGARSKGGDA